MRKPKKKAAPKAKAKAKPAKAQKAKPAKRPTPKTEIDRSPATIAAFIVASAEKGVTMAQLEKKFDMDGHPLRSKIHAAKHRLGFQIVFHADRKVYTGNTPVGAAAA